MQKEAEKAQIDKKTILKTYYSLFDYLKVFNSFVEKKLKQSFYQTTEALKVREIEGLSMIMDPADVIPSESAAPSVSNDLSYNRLAVIPEESKHKENDRISKYEEDKISSSLLRGGSINQ